MKGGKERRKRKEEKNCNKQQQFIYIALRVRCSLFYLYLTPICVFISVELYINLTNKVQHSIIIISIEYKKI
jgi:hypothetical protein